MIHSIKTEATSNAIGVQCDLQNVEAPQKIVDAAVEAFGPKIDILVNNAAMISSNRYQDITPEHFDEVFHLNVRAPLLMLQAVSPHLRRPGRIINLSSVGGRAGYPGTGTYSASKGAIEAYTRNWAAELGQDGTTVNAVNPGPVESEMLDQVDPQIVDAQKKATPIESRVGKAEEVAAIIAFVAEDRSSWVTGQCISARSVFRSISGNSSERRADKHPNLQRRLPDVLDALRSIIERTELPLVMNQKFF